MKQKKVTRWVTFLSDNTIRTKKKKHQSTCRTARRVSHSFFKYFTERVRHWNLPFFVKVMQGRIEWAGRVTWNRWYVRTSFVSHTRSKRNASRQSIDSDPSREVCGDGDDKSHLELPSRRLMCSIICHLRWIDFLSHRKRKGIHHSFLIYGRREREREKARSIMTCWSLDRATEVTRIDFSSDLKVKEARRETPAALSLLFVECSDFPAFFSRMITKGEHTIRLFEDQDFETIRLQCRQRAELFEDPFFPARLESLAPNYRQAIPQWREISWRRPGEIVDDPQLIVNGIRRTDPNQGELGNCWFIAAMSALTQNSAVLRRVIPADQSFHSDWYGEWRREEIGRMDVQLGSFIFVSGGFINGSTWSSTIDCRTWPNGNGCGEREISSNWTSSGSRCSRKPTRRFTGITRV